MQQPLPKAEQERIRSLLTLERQARSRGFCLIAGVDEAGRGPLAGPVVASACILPRQVLIAGIDDSKRLSPEKREALFEELTQSPHVVYGVGQCDHQVIDRINILQATLQAMRQAVAALSLQPDYLLVDGDHFAHGKIATQRVRKGDQLSLSIAAASIIAKVLRDRIMRRYHTLFPHYGFHKHKGYPTRDHVAALREFGPCAIHRRSFRLT